MTVHTKKWKEKELAQLKKLIAEHEVIAIADLRRFPAALFQELRKKLKGKAVVRVSKTRVIKKALQASGHKKVLDDYTKESCAIIFTSMSPFELFAFLKKNKGSMPAKEGMVAEQDILIPAGDTGLPPGPALSDLKQAGLNVRIQGATIAIAEDKVVASAGQQITKPVASVLSKLNIKPIKIGLNIIAALEKEQVYGASVLDIDSEKMFSDFTGCHRKAINLAYNIFYFTPATVQLFLQKAFREAKEVALSSNYFSEETMPELLKKAKAQADALKGAVNEEVPKNE